MLRYCATANRSNDTLSYIFAKLSSKKFFYFTYLAYISSILINTIKPMLNNIENLWTIYLTCNAFPGKIKSSTVQADNLWTAQDKALSMYPGYTLYNPDC